MNRAISTAGVLLIAMGTVGVIAAILALNRSPSERSARFTPSRDLSEAVADPDMGPDLLAYAE